MKNHFQGGHFYLKDPLKGDSFGQFGIAFGCGVTLFALLPLLWFSIKKKDFFFVGASMFIILLIGLSLSGIVSMQA